MHTKLTTAHLITLLMILTSSSLFSAVTFTSTGSATTNTTKSDGTTNIPVGTAFVLIADTGSAGFGALTNNSIPTGSTFGVGDLLGGDTVFYSSTNTLAGRTNVNISNLDITTLAGKKFAVVWFDTATSSLITGDKYGIITDPTWLLPTVSSTLGFSTTTSASTPFLTNTAPGGTTLTVGVAAVPEPSRVMLLGLGLGAFVVRRRRNA